LVRQLITESVVLGVLGGVAGLAASHWAIAFGYPAVLSQVPLPSGYRDAFTIHLNPDWRIFAFALAVSIAAGVLFGLAPALNSAKARDGARGSSSWLWRRSGSVLCCSLHRAFCSAVVRQALNLVADPAHLCRRFGRRANRSVAGTGATDNSLRVAASGVNR
jgi:hypothetical protein